MTVEPGVEVRFEPGTGLYLGDENGSGFISAVGTGEAPVVFTSNAAVPAPGDWKGIIVNEIVEANLLTGGTCDASAVYTDNMSYFGCHRAFDGDTGTCYHSPLLSKNWIAYDFGPNKAQKVHRVRFLPYAGYAVKELLFQGSNSPESDWEAKEWTTLATINDGHEGWNEVLFQNDTPYRFVRLMTSGDPDIPVYFVLHEIEAYMPAEKSSFLENCLIEYGGNGGGSNLRLNGCGITIRDSTVRYSGGSGILLEGLTDSGPPALISGNIITDNTTHGIECGDTRSRGNIGGNKVDQNGSFPVRMGPMMELGEDNTFAGNRTQAVQVMPGEVERDTVWGKVGIGYVVTGDVVVRKAATLALKPGVQLRFEPDTGLYLGDENGGGILSAGGTEDSHVVFTSNAATPAPGDWKGIVVGEAVESDLFIDGTCNASAVYDDNTGHFGCQRAFDGDTDTCYHSPHLATNWLGYDFGANRAYDVKKVRFLPYAGYAVRELVVQGSNAVEEDWEAKEWTTLATVDDGHEGWNEVAFDNDTPYRFVRLMTAGDLAVPVYLVLHGFEAYKPLEKGSTLEHVTVEYGGSAGGGNLQLKRNSLIVRNSTVRYSGGPGISFEGLTEEGNLALISGSTVTDNSTYGIHSGDGASRAIIKENAISDNGSYPVRIAPATELKGNTFTGNRVQVVEVLPGVVHLDTVWHNDGIDYLITGDVTVRQRSSESVPTLAVTSGARLRFSEGTGLYVGDENGNGCLSARGTEGVPVVFTSNASAPAPGDWKGIVVNEPHDPELATGAILEYCTVEYGGHTHDGNVRIDNAEALLRFSTIRWSSHAGVYISGSRSSGTDVSCNEILDNPYGLYVTGQAFPLIDENNFSSNSSNALYTDNGESLDVRNNWWGDPEGPGDSVYGEVTFDPWLPEVNDCLFDETAPLLVATTPVEGMVLREVEEISFTLFEARGEVDDGAVIAGVTVETGSGTAIPGTVVESEDRFTFIPASSPLGDATYRVGFTAADTSGNTSAHEFFFAVEYDLDTDGDGLPDHWEELHFASLSALGADDPDSDGLSNLQEYDISSDPNLFDRDNDDDGLWDSWELSAFGDISGKGEDDTDGDGFTNLVEYRARTNPVDPGHTPSPGRYIEYDEMGRIIRTLVIEPLDSQGGTAPVSP